MLRWRGKEWVEDEDRKTTDTDREEEEEEEEVKDETERKAAKKTRRMKGEEEGVWSWPVTEEDRIVGGVD